MPIDLSLELFLSHFNEAVAVSTPNYPITSVWRESKLEALLSDIKDELKSSHSVTGTLPSIKDLILQLQRIGLIKELEVTQPVLASRKPPRFYRIDIGARLFAEPVDMAEILQASSPDGVLCYSSALRYYHLTTQTFSFQHIADLDASAGTPSPSPDDSPEPAPRQAPTPVERSDALKDGAKPRRESLGTPSFVYDGIVCYAVRRKLRTVPGIQERILSPRARIRITTPEQTLLDTLHKPFYSGGPSIVSEAWQQNPERMSPTKLAKLVAEIGNDIWARRAGYMMESLQLPANAAWNAAMDGVLARLDRTDEQNWLSLLPGVPYNSKSEKWMLLVP